MAHHELFTSAARDERERPEDIPLLVDTVLQRMGRPPSALSEQTRAMLSQYPWPGNVRELRNVVDQVVNLGEEALPEMAEAPSKQRPAGPELELPFKEAKERLIDGFERDYLKGLLERCEGNLSRAARARRALIACTCASWRESTGWWTTAGPLKRTDGGRHHLMTPVIRTPLSSQAPGTTRTSMNTGLFIPGEAAAPRAA